MSANEEKGVSAKMSSGDRDFRRIVFRGILVFAAASVVFFVVYVFFSLTGRPAITVDYVAELNRVSRPEGADDSMNAVPFYAKAVEVFGETPEELNVLLRKKYKELTEEEKGKFSDFIEEKSEAFEQIKLGAEKQYYWTSYEKGSADSSLIAINMPNSRVYRDIAQLLCFRSWMRAEEGEFEKVFDDIVICFKLGYHLKQTKTIVEQLVGVAIDGMAIDSLGRIVYENEIDEKLLAKVQKQIGNIYLQDDFEFSYESEKLMMYDEIQRCFSADGIFGGKLCQAGVARLDRGSTWRNLRLLLTHPDKQQTKENADRIYECYVKAGEKTPYQLYRDSYNMEADLEEMIKGNVLLGILTPAIWRVSELCYRNKIGYQAIITILGLLRYKDANGEYPESLDELVEVGFIKEVPLDPYSDGEIVYGREGEDFILYTVGGDFIDDGGVRTTSKDGIPVNIWDGKDGDYIFWPVLEEN